MHTEISAKPQPSERLRQQIRFCRADDGVRLACARVGQGLPLVKTATWLSHLEFDCDNPVWRPMIEALSQRYQFLRYDERGCGLSDREVADLSFERWVDDLERVVDSQGLERFALLGLSQGAAVAIAYAARHPERVSHLLLHGAYARGRLLRDPSPEQRREAELMVELAEIGWGRADDAFRQFFTSQFIPAGTPEQQRWFNELERVSTSPANAARLMREFDRIDVTHLLHQVQCPTLVLHSRHDRRVPFDEGRRVAGGIRGARFVPIESDNHLLLAQERGWRHWLAEIEDFLAPASAELEAAPTLAELTPRQRELLNLIAQGRDNTQIAALLGVSEKTVRNHITAIFARIGVVTRPQAIVLAREAGLGGG